MDEASLAGMFKDKVFELLNRVYAEEFKNIDRASELCASSVSKGGLIYVFGTGHSMLMAMEVFYRAGGLAYIYPILDGNLMGINGASMSSSLERLTGYAKILLEGVRIVENSAMVIVSNSGVNQAPVEVAHEAKSRGMPVIAVTSVSYSSRLQPRNTFGKRLYEVADVTIDNKVPEGEALIDVDGYRMGAVSNIVNSYILHTLELLTAYKLIKMGVKPDVWVSANIPGGRERNVELLEKYRRLVKYL